MRMSYTGTLAAILILMAQAASAAFDPAKPTMLITGGNRGIGLELVQQYAGKGWNVIATARDPADAAELQALAKAQPRVIVEKLDVTDFAGVDALAARYKDQPIDVLISNAARTPRYLSAMKGASTVDFAEARNSFEINALGALKVITAFMPNVEKSGQKKIAVISSKAGSFGEGPKMPMMYEYRTSKAALNMIVYTLGFETAKKGIVIAAISPGSVDTKAVEGELGFGTSFKQPNAIPTAESVAGIIKVIDGLTPAENGKFLDYKDGRVLSW